MPALERVGAWARPRARSAGFALALDALCALTAYFEDRIWNGRYARVLPLDEVLAELERGPRADG